ncbi:MAG: DUF6768 family protein [Flavobacteriaceae bacterium]
MKKKKENIDELIRETLSAEEAEFYDTLEEKDLFGKLEAVYRGKMGWLSILITIIQLLIFVVFIGFLVLFLQTDAMVEQIKYGAAGFLCLIAMSMLKLFIWMQMDKNDLLREIKKLELLLVSHIEQTKH